MITGKQKVGDLFFYRARGLILAEEYEKMV